ncbi:ATP-binding protein [Celeribacter indicus]|uniref:histidine kinase n=1 Tax=Celeribacter indicus TaxID=1208324 RepID=A0A0B5DW23_9RHOB|nr:ATP-binding protein [Celeribacter indicus]AJE47194.1 histidine kinase [Celeribacter indicus]SDW00420.1 two-component system, OmpR family, osmolarity sensor histidine kinase EnvZ [Celeribacter indicus]
MFFAWLKRYLPGSLYGRAALILLVPMVMIQLVVLVAFSQRYFEDITRQLMRGVVAEVGLYVDAIAALEPEDLPEAMAALDRRIGFVADLGAAAPVTDARPWYDFSARVIASDLRAGVEGIEGVDTASDRRAVRVSARTAAGRLLLEIPRTRASARNPHQLMVWTLFTGVVMTLIAAIFLRNQLRPIRQLSEVAEAFGRGESKPYRLAGATEVRSAGAAFLNMRARIERQIEQRTLMLSGVSHDLRTPLTRIRLGLSMLEVSEAEAEEVAAMQGDLDEMERLIDAFLAFARSDTTEEPQPCDLREIVQAAKAKAERAGGQVALGTMPDAPEVLRVRPEALARALDNLVGNGLRYGDAVRISLKPFERAAVISIEDNGPGIAEDVRERALQPFVRLDAARNQNLGSGVGLGLSIAHDIARRHGGTLRLGVSEDMGGLKADLVIAR